MSTEYLKQAAILGAFVEKVRVTGYACGETLLQKAAYVMKELFGVPLSDEFRIHYLRPVLVPAAGSALVARSRGVSTRIPTRSGRDV